MNRALPSLALAALLSGCDSGDTGPSRQQIGSVETADGTAEVWDSSTYFYFEQNGSGDATMALLFSAAEDLSCAEVAAAFPYSGTGELGDYDPRPANIPGTCTLTVTDPQWDGELKATLAEGDKTTEATVSLDCFLDGGDWAEGADGWGYAPEELKWNAQPTSFDLDVSGEEGADATWAVELPTLKGKPYGTLEDYAPITGSVSGSGSAAWCADLASSSLFPG